MANKLYSPVVGDKMIFDYIKGLDEAFQSKAIRVFNEWNRKNRETLNEPIDVEAIIDYINAKAVGILKLSNPQLFECFAGLNYWTNQQEFIEKRIEFVKIDTNKRTVFIEFDCEFDLGYLGKAIDELVEYLNQTFEDFRGNTYNFDIKFV